jgi:hypothetical protein
LQVWQHKTANSKDRYFNKTTSYKRRFDVQVDITLKAAPLVAFIFRDPDWIIEKMILLGGVTKPSFALAKDFFFSVFAI